MMSYDGYIPSTLTKLFHRENGKNFNQENATKGGFDPSISQEQGKVKKREAKTKDQQE